MASLASMLRRTSVGVLAALLLSILLLPSLSSPPPPLGGGYGGQLPALAAPKLVPALDEDVTLAHDAYEELDYRWGDGRVLFVEPKTLAQVGGYSVLGIAPYHPLATHFDPVRLTPGQRMQVYVGFPPDEPLPPPVNHTVPVPSPPWLGKTVQQVHDELEDVWGEGNVDVVKILRPDQVPQDAPHLGISPDSSAATPENPVLLTAGQMMHVYVGGANH